ncbi:MAG: transglutaminase-like domain-containing protein [Xanthobacteraceae bacterium]
MRRLWSDAAHRTVDEPRIIERLLLNGWACELRNGERSSVVHQAREALNRLVAIGLPFEQSNTTDRRFDPAEVINFLKWASVEGKDRFWEERSVHTARNLVREFHRAEAPALPPPPNVLGPKRFHVTLRREFSLAGCETGTRMRLRLPLPLEDGALSDLKIVSVPPAGVDASLTLTPGRLEARLVAPDTRSLELAIRASFTAYPTIPRPPAARLSPAETELYTRPREGVIKVTPRVRALAEELAGSIHEPRAAVQSFWNFMHDYLAMGVVRYDEVDSRWPTDWVLETEWFDCQLGSSLLAALCRAHRIPSRVVSGYLLYSACPTYHYWAEVWLDDLGWTPFDLACSDLSANGRDKPWRNYFFGALDYRMKTECLPRLFTGMSTIHFPPAWHLLGRGHPEGAEIGIFDNETGAPVYRDHISIHRETGSH